MLKKVTAIFLCLAILVTGICFDMRQAKVSAGNIVIVLDAGHDDTHAGARGNGLKEEDLNVSIALACKAELETYEGVTVYMIRDGGNCPYGGNAIGNSVSCNQKRVEYAKSVGATAYISIHNNSSTNTSARGAGVYIPTTNYNYHCGAVGSALGQSVLNELLAIGLKNRGTTVRLTENDTRYPDGSLADYYAVIKNNKFNGIPAIIIEHAFVSNASDASEYLNSQDKLVRLGVCDATGIAKYYGLRKKNAVDYSKVVINGYRAEDMSRYILQAANISAAPNVKFAVWSENGGQDDLIWYRADKDSNGVWIADVKLQNHHTEGRYIVHAYAEENRFLGELSFHVQGPERGALTVGNINQQKGTFDLIASDISSESGIGDVSLAVWSMDNQENLQWYNAILQEDGTYRAVVNINNHQYQYGTYTIHAYVKDNVGISKCVAVNEVTFLQPDALITVASVEDTYAFNVQAQNVPYGNGVKNVLFAIWSDENGQDDLVWYEGRKLTGDVWESPVYLSNHCSFGNYIIDVYVKLKNGQLVKVGDSNHEVPIQELERIAHATPIDNEKLMWETDCMRLTAASEDFVLSEQTVSMQALQLKSTSLTMQNNNDANAFRDYINNVKDKIFTGFVAYDLQFLYDGSTVDTQSEIDLEFTLPQSMVGEKLTVLMQSEKDGIVQIEPIDATISADGSKVSVHLQRLSAIAFIQEEEILLGDADVNSQIELKDAQIVLRAALGIMTLEGVAFKAADVNQDGHITLMDAQKVLRAALRIEEI